MQSWAQKNLSKATSQRKVNHDVGRDHSITELKYQRMKEGNPLECSFVNKSLSQIMLVDGYKGQKVQDVKKPIQKMMVEKVKLKDSSKYFNSLLILVRLFLTPVHI